MGEKKEAERTAALLASFLPEDGTKRYMAVGMNTEEIAERRSYIRRKLVGSSFDNLPNSEIDNSVYYELGERKLFVDSKGYCYALGGKTREDGEFRKARALMPYEYMGLRTKDFRWDVYPDDTSAVKETLNRYLLNFPVMSEKGMGLYIYSGTKGSGKTMLSCCILNEIAEKHAVSVKFINILDLLEMTKSSYKQSQKGDSVSGDIQSIYNATVLVLDDIGVQTSKEWVDSVLYRLINARYSGHKVTMYTSNVRIDALKIDDRIRDRIDASTFQVDVPEIPVRRQQSELKKRRLFQSLGENARGSSCTGTTEDGKEQQKGNEKKF